MQQLTQQQIAWRVAQDIPGRSSVYLGSGMPALVRNYVPVGRGHMFQEDGMPGRPIDYSVLGVCEVAGNGDFVSKDLPAAQQPLAVGAKQVFVMTEYFAKDGRAKVMPVCTLPLTGMNCVTTIYTDIAILDLIKGKVWVRELIEGITLHTLQAESDVQLWVSPQLTLLNTPALP